ncbi:MAG: S-layer homology domain-containing protein [Oscillospiraceae bacterium]
MGGRERHFRRNRSRAAGHPRAAGGDALPLCRLPAVSGELSFDDTTVISIWAYDAVRWCVDNGILNGVGGNRMAPQDLAQRGQVAAMLMRFLQATV